MANSKMTKKDYFAIIRKMVESTNREDKVEMLAFIDHEVELLSKKKSSTNSKKDAELEALCVKVEDALRELGKPVTVSELMKESTHEVATLSNQKLSALLKKCVDVRKTVDKTVDKKKSYFSIKEEV